MSKTILRNWLTHVTSSFGPLRITFGTDWPVCNIGGRGNRVAWNELAVDREERLLHVGLTQEIGRPSKAGDGSKGI